MAAGDPFCTLDEAKSDLGIKFDTEDANLTRMIAGASAATRRHCNREILLASYTKTFIGSGGLQAFIPGSPIASVDGVFVDGAPIAQGEPGFIAIGNTVHLRGFSFTRGAVCEIQYTAGYEAVPDDVKQATLRLVSVWQSKRGHPDLSSKGANGETTAYDTSPLPKDVQHLLRQFVQYTPGA